jgi:hypothetical protein
MCIVDPAACRHAGDESRGSAKLLDGAIAANQDRGDRARLYLLSRNPMLRGCRFVVRRRRSVLLAING